MKIYLKELKRDLLSKGFWGRLLITIISIFIFALNYNTFLLPNNLVTGGTGGIATIINHYFGIEPSVFIFIFNAIFLILSLFLMGLKSTSIAFLGSIAYPIAVSLTKAPGEYLSKIIVVNDFLLIVIISGLIAGFTTGLIFKTDCSTSGTDILMQMVNKYFKIPTGVVSFVLNFVIVSVGGITFGLNNAIYATIIIAINSIMVDKIMLGISDSKMFYIHTKKPEQIKNFIKTIDSGYTIMKTEGGYTKEENDIIMCVISTRDYYRVKTTIEEIDSNAFFVISDCYEVHGGKRKHNFPFL